ncbi:MAG TPA: rRNA adenine dimethylase [Desulfobulbaceae bacterium]|nr:rRNA adenine dimethylase [Desulfobulbaceae bacterium]
MKELAEKYARRLIIAGLAEAPLVCGLEDEIVWNREDDRCAMLAQVIAGMHCNALICAEPAEPYRTILSFLVRKYPIAITPGDCETRTFLHDLPVSSIFSAEAILAHLHRRKSVTVAEAKSLQIVTFGTVSPEQAFVTFSSVCFSAFVLFFADYLADLRASRVTAEEQAAFARAVSLLNPPPAEPPELLRGPFTSENQVIAAMIEAGLYTVGFRLVDSYFGNISCRLDDTVYISQTGSSLDELAGCIDPCPLDGSSCAGITASSELVAHNEIYLRKASRTILHGHPPFAVILSMDCDVADCPNRGQCHVRCSLARFIRDVPIIPGEVGTGPTGLCHTLPPAITNRRGAIVWGHGLFTTGTTDFNEPFSNLLDIENMCRQEYFARIRAATDQKNKN